MRNTKNERRTKVEDAPRMEISVKMERCSAQSASDFRMRIRQRIVITCVFVLLLLIFVLLHLQFCKTFCWSQIISTSECIYTHTQKISSRIRYDKRFRFVAWTRKNGFCVFDTFRSNANCLLLAPAMRWVFTSEFIFYPIRWLHEFAECVNSLSAVLSAKSDKCSVCLCFHTRHNGKKEIVFDLDMVSFVSVSLLEMNELNETTSVKTPECRLLELIDAIGQAGAFVQGASNFTVLCVQLRIRGLCGRSMRISSSKLSPQVFARCSTVHID